MIKDNETTPLTLTMQPNFAEVEISAPNDATIWIDNNEKGTGLWQERLDAGIYTIEARKDKHITHKKDIEVKAGEKLKVELRPTPRYGKIDIITMPPMAKITLNGKNYGTTPNTINDLLIGEYNLTLTKDGLETINKTISIYENKTTEVNEKLDSIKNKLIDCSPKQLGINEKKLNLIDSIANFGIKESAYPSCQILIAKDGLIFYNKSFGTTTYKSNNFVKNTYLYDISDITKVAATTIAIMKLYDDKKIDLDKNLSFYLKYLKNTNKDGITIRQILSHQERLKECIHFYKENLINGNLNNTIYSAKQDNSHNIKVANSIYILDNYKEKIIKSIIDSDIYDKEEYVYSDLGFYLLKELVEKISNQSFEQYLNDHFYSPLGLKHLCFNPLNKHQLDEIIPTGYDDFFRKQLIHAYAIDPGASMLGGIAGHSGLFSNANDLAVIFQCLLQDGEYSGIKILNPSTIKLFTSQQYPGNNNRRALGFDRQLLHPLENGPACKSASQLSYGHNGFTGTYVWIDPVEKILYIFLSNSINPDFLNDKLKKLNIIKNIHQIVYDILSENKKIN
jgi:CubicO group peptidase (beta-lactamase class C family)